MNQQEIDRLWESHSDGPLYDLSHTEKPAAFRYMRKHDFTAAIQEATAQARREALDEAAQVCGKRANACYRTYEQSHNVDFLRDGHEAEGCELAILDLAAQPQEGKV